LNDEDVLSAMKLKAYDRIDLGDSSFIFIPFEYDWKSSEIREAPPDEPNTAPEEPPRHRGRHNETEVR